MAPRNIYCCSFCAPVPARVFFFSPRQFFFLLIVDWNVFHCAACVV